MNNFVVTTCPFCGTDTSIRQICAEQYTWGGAAFGCSVCHGAFFQRHASLPWQDEYWEGDTVNEQVYTVPEVRAAFARKYKRYLTLLGRHHGGGKSLLEVGCGSGIFLDVAAKHGWKVHGLDVSPQAIELARQYCPTARLVCSPLEKAVFEPNSFDLVALWDVIEHVEELEVLLRDVWSLLRVEGLLIMETPDEQCLPRRAIRFVHQVTQGRVSFLNLLYYPAHRWYFSRQAMTLMLQRIGFDRSRFYREITVKEFAALKGTGYGMQRTLFQRIVSAVAGVMGLIPILRNKMIVVAVKSR